MIVIGIDPGKHTGLAGWSVTEQRLVFVDSLLVHRAIDRVREVKPYLVIFEDARQSRTGASAASYGDPHKLQGVGSVKRDSTIWEDLLTDEGIPYIAKPPCRGATKWDAKPFQRLTRWEGRTNSHGRDAAMLIFQLNKTQIEGMMRMHS